MIAAVNMITGARIPNTRRSLRCRARWPRTTALAQSCAFTGSDPL